MARRVTLLLVALAAVAPYLATLGGGFVYDDRDTIEENDRLASLAGVPGYFATDVWTAVGGPRSTYYRPLMYASFALESAVAGGRRPPWLFRGTNLLLHAAASVCVCLLIARSGGTRAAAGLGGLLFALHPMHAEVVAWPSARPDLLTTLFGLLAALLAVGAPGRWRWRRLAALACATVALFSKETAVLLPALVVVVAWLSDGGEVGSSIRRLRAAVLAALPFALLAVVFLVLRGRIIRGASFPPLVGADQNLYPFRSLSEAVAAVGAIAGRYLGLMLAPVDASSFRMARGPGVTWGLALVPVGLAACAGAFAPWRGPHARAARRVCAWLAFAFVTMAAQSLALPATRYLGQRYAYLPSVGVCAALAELAAAAFLDGQRTTRRRRAGLALVAALGAAWAALLVPRAMQWSDERRLWPAQYALAPQSPPPMLHFAYRLMDTGRAADALPLFDRVERIAPGDPKVDFGRGNALASVGRVEEAIPRFQSAARRAPESAQLWQSLAFAYQALGDHARARDSMARALALFPDSSSRRGWLAEIDGKLRRAEGQLAAADAALASNPADARARLVRAQLLRQLGRDAESAAASQPLLADPAVAPGAHLNLAVIYDRYRDDPARAALHYRRALELGGLSARSAEAVRRRLASLPAGGAGEAGGAGGMFGGE